MERVHLRADAVEMPLKGREPLGQLQVRPMLGFKAFWTAAVTLAGIEMIHMMRKRQGRFVFNPFPTLKEQFEAIAA